MQWVLQVELLDINLVDWSYTIKGWDKEFLKNK